MLNLNYEFDTMKSFPKDMPSRQGYEILEEKFEKGDLAPTTVLLERTKSITPRRTRKIISNLSDQPLINNVRINGLDRR